MSGEGESLLKVDFSQPSPAATASDPPGGRVKSVSLGESLPYKIVLLIYPQALPIPSLQGSLLVE